MAKLAEYHFKGAASGTTPTTVTDESGNGNGLTINFNTDDGAWGEDASGRYLSIPEAPNTSPAVARVAMNAGGLGAALDGATTFLIMFKTLGVELGDYPASPLIAIGEEGAATDLEISVTDSGASGAIILSGLGGEAGFYDRASTIICFAIDTTQATAADRIKIYRRNPSNVNETIATPPFYSAPAQNAALTGINNATTYLSVLNYADGTHNADAAMKYLRFESGTMTESAIYDAMDALAADDDADPMAGGGGSNVNLMAGKFGALLAGKL